MSRDGDVRGTELKLSLLASGIEAELAAGTKLAMGGEPLTIAQVRRRLDQFSADYALVRECRAALAVAVKARDDVKVARRVFIANVVASVIALLGPENPKLSKLGIKPRKPRTQPTSEQKVLAAAKARQTRAARGTKGRRQREAITTAPPVRIVIERGGQVGGTQPSPVGSNGGSRPSP